MREGEGQGLVFMPHEHRLRKHAASSVHTVQEKSHLDIQQLTTWIHARMSSSDCLPDMAPLCHLWGYAAAQCIHRFIAGNVISTFFVALRRKKLAAELASAIQERVR